MIFGRKCIVCLVENPCLTGEYTELSEQDRAAGYLATGRERCDGSKFAKKEAWYRFTGNAGCRMAEGCVPGKHCSSGAAGWLNGSHPRDEDEGAVNRTVCFRWKDDCCKRKIQIKVRKCAGNFFLYLLKRNPWKKVSCSYRYCGNGEGKDRTKSSSLRVNSSFAILTSPIIHFICPPKFCIIIVFNFSWDD